MAQEVVPVQTTDSTGGLNFLLGLIALVVLLYVLFVYGLPALRNSTSAPQINVPGQIDVNVKQQ